MTATWLTDRALLRIAGDDARDFLQGLVTQDVARVQPGAPAWAGLLTPQGKVLFDFLLWDDGDAVLIDCEAAEAEALARRLAMYRLRRQVTIEPQPQRAVHWMAEGEAGVADPRLAALGHRRIGEPGGEDAAAAWRAHRLRLGVTEGVAELGGGTTLWLECNARELNGVSFAKGCYVGQENTARMHHRDKVARRLAVLPLPQDDARISYDDIGLAVVHRRVDALPAGSLRGWISG